ncbi:BRI1 kinase inhibitor 1 [Euphorbia lathyris]|uniref:BRI1 kinase inhibitor 1 n=1 Tax=Euphorbia lathyris TaxID=212925 RepID=UPI003313C696
MEDTKHHTNTNIEANKVPSSSSSPSHEFSFTISLHSSSTPLLENNKASKSLLPPPPPFAIDLSPADDIFFHGHLLPLHLLSHLPVSPRSSTNSIDSFTLPIRDLLDDHQIPNQTTTPETCIAAEIQKPRNKPKSFSFFRWRKGCEVGDGEDKDKQKKKVRFEVTRVLKRYLRMVRPLLFFKGRRSENVQFHRQQPYNSFSGNLSWRSKPDLRGRRGEFSAPASMRTSPTNSGHLVAKASMGSCGSDSTMEELQAAIQAAIAHCKNSIAAEDKIKC